ncbi:MAG: hypothetical protein IPL27_22495 [Lewinellaceae bacterium]|nr:hypothetical protein [Lewinellaceae bacterium]
MTCFVALLGLLSMANPRTEHILIPFSGSCWAWRVSLWRCCGFATDHSATKSNYNLMWAMPTHLLVFWRLRARKTAALFYRYGYPRRTGACFLEILATGYA